VRRRLSPDEASAWAKVMASVRPIKPVPVPQPASPSRSPSSAASPVSLSRREREGAPQARKGEGERVRPTPHHAATLDASWDRRLSRGLTQPDSSLDLHGHTLASAHALLDRGLERAIAHGDRVLLLVTGKPPRPESERPHARGAIRAAVADWLAQSRHADRIAAVRNAHPRHGGAGALYIVLRRR
jgi:DNA-nicking Smr family endonuclease